MNNKHYWNDSDIGYPDWDEETIIKGKPLDGSEGAESESELK